PWPRSCCKVRSRAAYARLNHGEDDDLLAATGMTGATLFGCRRAKCHGRPADLFQYREANELSFSTSSPVDASLPASTARENPSLQRISPQLRPECASRRWTWFLAHSWAESECRASGITDICRDTADQ